VRVCLLSLLLALIGQTADAEVIDRIAAVVNNKVITLRDVQRAAGPMLRSLDGISDPERRSEEEASLLRRTLDDLVGQTLVLQEAQKLKLDAEAKEVDAWLENLKRQYGWSDEQLRSAIESQGTSMVRYREDVRRRIVTNRVVQVKLGSSVRVSDQDVEDLFEREHGGETEQPEVTVRHILFVVAEGAPEADAQAKLAKAQGVLVRLQAGEEFDQLARDHSEGPSAAKGGSLGAFLPGSLDPDFARAALEAEVGAYIGPVRTRFGYHLIQVTRRRMVEKGEPERLRREIRARLRQEGLERQLKLWIDELKREAFVDVRL